MAVDWEAVDWAVAAMVEVARAEADAFQVPLRGVGTGLHPGALEGEASLLETGPQDFRLSAERTYLRKEAK